MRQGSQECESCQSFLSAALITGGGLGWFLGGDPLRTWMRLTKFRVFAKAQWRKGTESVDSQCHGHLQQQDVFGSGNPSGNMWYAACDVLMSGAIRMSRLSG